MKLFGFNIERDRKPDLPALSFPENQEGAIEATSAGGAFASYLDLEAVAKTDADLIMKYREMAEHPECDMAIENIIQEATPGNPTVVNDLKNVLIQEGWYGGKKPVQTASTQLWRAKENFSPENQKKWDDHTAASAIYHGKTLIKDNPPASVTGGYKWIDQQIRMRETLYNKVKSEVNALKNIMEEKNVNIGKAVDEYHGTLSKSTKHDKVYKPIIRWAKDFQEKDPELLTFYENALKQYGKGDETKKALQAIKEAKINPYGVKYPAIAPLEGLMKIISTKAGGDKLRNIFLSVLSPETISRLHKNPQTGLPRKFLEDAHTVMWPYRKMKKAAEFPTTPYRNKVHARMEERIRQLLKENTAEAKKEIAAIKLEK